MKLELTGDIKTEIELMNHVAYMIKTRRREIGISQETVASFLAKGTDFAWVSRLENNKKKEISFWMLYLVVTSLGGEININFKNV